MESATQTSKLETRIGQLVLKNPVMPASGTFGYGREYADLVDIGRLGAVVTKAISPEARSGNAPQRICETDAGMLNTIGLQNDGAAAFVTEKLPYLREQGTVLVGNVVGAKLEDYVAVVGRLEEYGGLDAYELNLSCPNVSQGCIEFGQQPASVQSLVTAVRAITERSLWVKLSPNVNDIRPLGLAAQEAGADAVVAINTLIGMAIDVRRRRPVLSRKFGGLSGPAIRPVAVRMVYQLAEVLDIPVIGVGGIMTTEHALEFLMAGAKAVQVGTANFVDPTVMPTIIEGLQGYLDLEGLASIADVMGAAHR